MTNEKVALISGAKGQDASWLSDILLSKGWTVVAFERHTQNPDYSNIRHLFENSNFILEHGDVTDFSSIARLLNEYKPEHLYHLASNSFVGCSWDEAISVLNTNAVGTLNCLEALRTCSPRTRMLFASTSETVGNSLVPIQNEETPHTPRSPYAVSKCCGEHLISVYRESHGLFVCFTRCYNHESVRRSKEFVTRKITDWIGKAYNRALNYYGVEVFSEDLLNRLLREGVIDKLYLGNLNSSRDWLDARDCVMGMFNALSYHRPEDFVLASGKMHSIDDLLKVAFGRIGVNDHMKFIGQDSRFMRPNDVVTLCGNYAKAKRLLGWEPSISFEDMINEMVDNDIRLNKNA